MELAKITSKGQITLPISIRRALHLKDGDKVAFIEKKLSICSDQPGKIGYPGGTGWFLWGSRQT